MANIPSRVANLVAEKYTKENNTFSREVKSNPKDRIAVDVGDAKQADFKPQLKVMRWDNEINASFRAPEDPQAVVRTEGEVIKYVAPDGYEVHQYDKPDVSEDGGFEIELLFNNLPSLVKRATVVGDNYRIVLTTQFKNVVGYKQPPLTQEEIDEGAHRPDNVINSIAFYHSSKGGMNRADGMEYKVGKAFHLYRIKLIDKDGNETWGDQNWLPESNELEILLPKVWVDKCVFPLVVDPTFGYTSLGAIAWGAIADNVNDNSQTYGMAFSLTEDGNITNMSFGLKNDTAAQALDLYYAVYRENSAGSDSHDLVASSETNNVTVTNATVEWYDLSFASELLVADDYILAAIGNGEDLTTTNNTCILYADNVGGSNRYYNESTTGSGSYATRKAEDPWTEVDTTSVFKFSIYATYTASGGTDADPTLSTNTGTLALPAPSVTAETNVTVNASIQELTSTNNSPTISVGDGATPATIDTTLTPPAPSVSGDANVTAGVQTLTSNNPSSIQSGDANVTAGIVTINQTYVLPTTSLESGAVNVTVNADAQTLTLTAPSASVTASGNVTTNQEANTGTLEALSPTVTTTSSVSYTPDTQTLTSALESPTVSGNANPTLATQEGTLALPAPTVIVADTASPDANTTTLTALSPTVTATASVSVDTQTLTTTLLDPTPSAGGAYVKNAPLYYEIGSGLSMMLGSPKIPVWTTVGRPTGVNGLVGFNRETQELEIYDANTTAWYSVALSAV